ncbi:MAG: hypothetical protein V3V08_21590 [Nannocystaceae bacterium]
MAAGEPHPSYFKLTPESTCGLTEMWKHPFEGAVFTGGGGSFEEDGYAAEFRDGLLKWIWFSTSTGPLRSPEATPGDLSVTTESGVRLRINRESPYSVAAEPGQIDAG